ncbi:hypothetical protein M1310_00265 [Candidatus Marsarchaeota archaeon]|jgi:hypothetical protein|nr:hypothetical protein [Candidatus Marsarchaeota archaeon]
MPLEKQPDYEEMAKTVSDIDAASSASERAAIKIDVSGLFSSEQPQKAKYDDLLTKIEGAESKRAIFGAQKPGQQQQEVRGAKSPFEEQVEKAVSPEIGAPQADLQVPSTPVALKGIKVKKVNLKDLVLPNLSLPDQVSELERIIESISEGVLDQEHLDIVKQEVYGLYYFIELQRKQVVKEKKKLNSLEQSMWNLRDQRLVDAISALKQKPVGSNAS